MSLIGKYLTDQLKKAIKLIDDQKVNIAGIKTKNPKSQLEIELKIKNFSMSEFYRVIDFLNSNEEFKSFSNNSVDYYKENKRYTLLGNNFVVTQKESFTNPKRGFFNDDWNTVLAVNIEIITDYEGDINDIKLRKDFTRDKKRISFEHVNAGFRIDMTHVTTTRNKTITSTYECEIEFKIEEGKKYTIDDTSVVKVLQDIFVVRHNSSKLYTEKTKEMLINVLNGILSTDAKLENKLDHKFMAQARNLSFKDLVYGGIIGGKIKFNGTIKADGERKQLFVYHNQLWLLYPPHDFNLLHESENLTQYHGYMIDGEDILQNNRKEECDIRTTHMFIPFDMCLTPIKTQISLLIQSKPHNERLTLAKKVLKSLGALCKRENVDISFMEKDFIEIGDTFESLKSCITTLKGLINTVPYKTDGYMFTPINANYNVGTNLVPIYKRILTNYPDICKLKPWDHLTIDLLVDYKGSNKYRPATLMGKGRYGVEKFIGTQRYYFDQNNNVHWDDEMFSSIKQDMIVEFKPIKAESDEGDIIVLVPKQIRHNKTLPNRTDNAGAIWHDINDPIDETIFNSFKLLRRHFNKIKRSLYEDISKGSDIFEIGSGNGGQMMNWINHNKILCVEPDIAHIEEMNTRLDNYDHNPFNKPNHVSLQEKVNTVHGTAQDTKKILDAAKTFFKWEEQEVLPPFCMVSMLSLSFMWENLEVLNNFLLTLKSLTDYYLQNGGTDIKFLFFTIEGNKVLDLFNKSGMVRKNGNKSEIKLGPCDMSLSNSSGSYILEINIEGTIVDKQTEYLVNLDDFQTPDLELKSIKKELCMSESEIIYSKLFVTGKLNVKNNSFSRLNKMHSFDKKQSKSREKSNPAKLSKSQERTTSPERQSSANSPRSTLSRSQERTTSPKRQSSANSPRSTLSRSLDGHFSITKPDTNVVTFRLNGRADFLSENFFVQKRLHESESKKFLHESTNYDQLVYRQDYFGIDNNGDQIQSLECYKQEEDSTLNSLLDSILILTSTSYHKTKMNSEREKMKRRFKASIIGSILTDAKKKSDVADFLNQNVTSWANIHMLENIARYIHALNDINPIEIEEKYPNTECDRDKDGRLNGYVLFYKYKNTKYLVQPKNIPNILENKYESETEIVSLSEIFSLIAEGKLDFTSQTSKEKYISELKKELEKQEEEEGSYKMNELLVITKIKIGCFLVDEKYDEKFLSEIPNKTYLQAILDRQKISKNSVYYNCRGGYLFREFYSKYQFFEEDNNHIHFNMTKLHDLALIADSLNLNIKTFAMPDQDDNNGGIKYYDPTDNDQYVIINRRNFCIPKDKYSFYPTGEMHQDLLDAQILDLQELGNPNCGNIFDNSLPTIYLYYHHFEPKHRRDNKGKSIWTDYDITYNDEGNLDRSIFIPLGKLKEDYMLQTVF
jgi:hypothetical protein